jgi:hypothetical protein
MTDTIHTLSPQVQAVIAEFTPIIRSMAGDQRYAISVSGSLGKGTWDNRSDIDFRLYTDQAIPWAHQDPALWADYNAATQRWKEQGVIVDDIWPRPIGEIDRLLDEWSEGKIQPWPVVWTIWGYHVLPDMYSQAIIEDPYGIITAWKQRLSVYPPKLKEAILKKYLGSLVYWRSDYHYSNKVRREDVVFLAGMSAKLVHEIFQVLFALNETYFMGDGSNLSFAKKFAIQPPDLEARVKKILYPGGPDTGSYTAQYEALASLIDDVVAL